MPADPITPGLAAAFTVLLPAAVGVPSRFTAAVRAQSTQTIGATLTGTFDSVNLQGTLATVSSRAVLLTAQSGTTQNGIYTTGAGSVAVDISASFGGGTKVVSTLSPSRLYYWIQSNGYTATNGTETLTTSGFITASYGGSLTFTGPAGQSQTDSLYEAGLVRLTLFDAPNEFPVELVVNVTGGTSANTWWQLTSTVTSVGSSPIVFSQITVGNLDVGFEDDAFNNTVPDSKTPGNNTAFSNTAPDSTSNPLLDAPSAMTNTAPDGKTPNNNAAFNDTPAAALVLQGEQSPVAGITTPASPTAVIHSATLVAGTNYLVQVGARLAPVTVTLPDPGSLAQRIEIADITGQAGTHAITVNGGIRDIETAGQTSYTIDRNDAVLVLSYTGAKWKIL